MILILIMVNNCVIKRYHVFININIILILIYISFSHTICYVLVGTTGKKGR